MIFVDSGAWFASIIASDPDHSAALQWLNQNREPLVTSDYVIDETLTLLRARGQKNKADAFAAAVEANQLGRLHFVTALEFAQALKVFMQFRDKAWSFTDCSSKVIMDNLNVSVAFAFDQHFHQFGSVQVVP